MLTHEDESGHTEILSLKSANRSTAALLGEKDACTVGIPWCSVMRADQAGEDKDHT